MSASLTFTVPGPPQGKGRPRVGKIGGHARMFTPKKTVEYEQLIAHEAARVMRGHQPFEGAVGVALFIGCAVPASWSKKKREQALAGEIFPTTKPDKDNVIKAIYDGCNGVVWRDDCVIVDGLQRKRYAAEPGVRVEVWPVLPEREAAVVERLQGELLEAGRG